MKKIIPILLMTALLIMLASPAPAAATTVRVYVDGAEMSFPDQTPYINTDNRTLVPVRFVSEALGAVVDWLGTTSTVKINYEGKTILLQIGKKAATVGSGSVTLDTAPAIVNSRTMVPLRFVSECLGAEVEWKAAEQAVYITTKNSDQALVDSDLRVVTPPANDNPNKINLAVIILYKYTTPVEPQIADLKELLEKRFGDKAQPVIDYVSAKKTTRDRLLYKTWVINGKNVSVDDAVGSVAVTVWG